MTFPSLLRPSDYATVFSSSGKHTLQRAGEFIWSFRGGEARIAPAQGKEAWEVSLYAPGESLQALELRWEEEFPPGAWFLGDHWERAYGDLEWRECSPERVMPWYFLARDGRAAYACGVRTGADALCFWRADSQGVILRLDLRCGGEGVLLGERNLLAASLVEYRGQPGESPFLAACAFCRKLCDRPLSTEAPVYGANDFYYAYCENTHAGLARDAHTISELSPDPTNRPFCIVDAGWQWGGEANGAPWQLGNARFPDMPGLAQEIKAAGCRPGIWFRPLLTTESLPAGWTLPDERFSIVREPGSILDPSLPEVLERIAADVRTFKDWGYELVKHDYTTFDLLGRWGSQMGAAITDPGWTFVDRSRTTAEIVRSLYEKLREAAGSAILIACNTFGHLAAGAAHLQRVGDDTSGKEWARTRRMGINSLAFRIPQHAALFAVDADCVGITERVPWALNRQWLDLLSRSGTPLFVSLQPECLGKEQRAALRHALQRAAQPAPVAEPLDWIETPWPGRWRFGEQVVEYDFWRVQD